LLVCSVGSVVQQVTPSGVAGDVVYVGAGLAGAVAVMAGLHLDRPSVRSAWSLMTLGVILSAVADGFFGWIL
jgi:hypothetical protein